MQRLHVQEGPDHDGDPRSSVIPIAGVVILGRKHGVAKLEEGVSTTRGFFVCGDVFHT
jgi:hypothetical protein